MAERDAVALQMRRDGAPYSEIVAQTGITQSRISELARRAGLPRRTTADRVITDETRSKIAASMTGLVRSKTHRANISESKRGARNGLWRGDDVGYQAAHVWLREHYGTPSHCENCNGANAKSDCYDWAHLVSGGGHSRRREDYIRLCRSCHIRHDRYGMPVQSNYPVAT